MSDVFNVKLENCSSLKQPGILFLGVFRNFCWRHLVIKSILLFSSMIFNCENKRIIRMLIGMYKVIHHIVAIYPTYLLPQSYPRARQSPHSYSYRLIQTTLKILTSTNFSKNNSTMEPPTCSCSTIHYTRQFPRADPNICSRTTMQHLNT